MTQDIWFMKGSGHHVGLDAFRTPGIGEALDLSRAGVSHDDIKLHILRHISREEILCQLAPARERFEHVSANDFAEGTIAGEYARSVMTCPDMRLDANASYTLAAFYEQIRVGKSSSTRFIRQHSNLLWYYLPCHKAVAS